MVKIRNTKYETQNSNTARARELEMRDLGTVGSFQGFQARSLEMRDRGTVGSFQGFLARGLEMRVRGTRSFVRKPGPWDCRRKFKIRYSNSKYKICRHGLGWLDRGTVRLARPLDRGTVFPNLHFEIRNSKDSVRPWTGNARPWDRGTKYKIRNTKYKISRNYPDGLAGWLKVLVLLSG